MFSVLNIAKRTYYRYRNNEDRDYYDYLLIKEIFEESKNTYGYRRVCEGLLVKYGVTFNHKKIARIMQKYNLKPEYIKKLRPNLTYKRLQENVKPNLVKRQFNIDTPNKVWTTDITYLIFNNKRLYLSTILDLHDRKVVAYKISKFNNIPLVIDTLNEAIAKRKNVQGTIIHSDQGFQYTSYEYKAVCDSKGMQISMSRKGTPIDDSPMESWHGILKKETLYNNTIKDIKEYQALVEDWIEFYNTKRIKNRKKLKISS
jgi:putative transposase